MRIRLARSRNTRTFEDGNVVHIDSGSAWLSALAMTTVNSYQNAQLH